MTVTRKEGTSWGGGGGVRYKTGRYQLRGGGVTVTRQEGTSWGGGGNCYKTGRYHLRRGGGLLQNRKVPVEGWWGDCYKKGRHQLRECGGGGGMTVTRKEGTSWGGWGGGVTVTRKKGTSWGGWGEDDCYKKGRHHLREWGGGGGGWLLQERKVPVEGGWGVTVTRKKGTSWGGWGRMTVTRKEGTRWGVGGGVEDVCYKKGRHQFRLGGNGDKVCVRETSQQSALVYGFLPWGDTVGFVAADVVARGHVVAFVRQPSAGTGYICKQPIDRYISTPNQSINMYLLARQTKMHIEWGMVSRAFIIKHTLTVIGFHMCT